LSMVVLPEPDPPETTTTEQAARHPPQNNVVCVNIKVLGTTPTPGQTGELEQP
jgi:hypothetical protein